jgi:hypothetical protein
MRITKATLIHRFFSRTYANSLWPRVPTVLPRELVQFFQGHTILWLVRLIMGWAFWSFAGFSHVRRHQTSRIGKSRINLACGAGMSLVWYLTWIIARYQYQSQTSSCGTAASSKKLKMHRFAWCGDIIQEHFKWLFREDLQRHLRCVIQNDYEILTISPHLLLNSILNAFFMYHKLSRERPARHWHRRDAIDLIFS